MMGCTTSSTNSRGAAHAAVDADDEARILASLAELLAFVRANGSA